MSETDLQRAILEALAARGYWAMRVNSGARPIAATGSNARRMIRLAPPGTPDVLVIKPYCWLEVKLAKGRLTDYQSAWHARAQAAKVRAAVVRSVSEALRYVDQCAKEDRVKEAAVACPVERCPLEDP